MTDTAYSTLLYPIKRNPSIVDNTRVSSVIQYQLDSITNAVLYQLSYVGKLDPSDFI